MKKISAALASLLAAFSPAASFAGGDAAFAGSVAEVLGKFSPLRPGSSLQPAEIDVPGAPVSNGAQRADMIDRTRRGAVVIQIRHAEGEGTGAGFFVSEDGYILTNWHVATAEGKRGVTLNVRARCGNQRLTLPATVAGLARGRDIAILKINGCNNNWYVLRSRDGGNGPQDWFSAYNAQVFGRLRSGTDIIAWGNPLGLTGGGHPEDWTGIATSGTLANDSSRGNPYVSSFVLMSAPAAPGNSGGPVLDDTGRVIGMTTQLPTNGQSSFGLAQAIPLADLKRALVEFRSTRRLTDVDAPFDITGSFVVAKAGGGFNLGDTITALDGQALAPGDEASVERFLRRVVSSRVGASISVTKVPFQAVDLLGLTRGLLPNQVQAATLIRGAHFSPVRGQIILDHASAVQMVTAFQQSGSQAMGISTDGQNVRQVTPLNLEEVAQSPTAPLILAVQGWTVPTPAPAGAGASFAVIEMNPFDS